MAVYDDKAIGSFRGRDFRMEDRTEYSGIPMVEHFELKWLVIPKRGTIARGICCAALDQKQIPRR
jgi:hypothetical protein